MSDHPKPTGAGLDDGQIEEISKTVYNRYHYTYGLKLPWNDDRNKENRDRIILSVKCVLDVLNILGYRFTKTAKKNSGRAFLSKACDE